MLRLEDFVHPKSVLAPAVGGVVTMILTNALSIVSGSPGSPEARWTALAFSLAFGLVSLVDKTGLPWKRALFYLLTSLVICAVAIGTNVVAASLARASGDGGVSSAAQLFFSPWF